MHITVIIPTRARPEKLAACLTCLARQDLDPSDFEVLVGIDGPEDGEVHAQAEAGFGRLRSVLHEFSRRGQAAVRNALIPHARGRLLVFLNDDMLPTPSFLSAHLHAHTERAVAGKGPAIILGDSPWVIPPHTPDRLFDRLIRETSMIFFYDQMSPPSPSSPNSPAGDPDHDWGFRHAWLLNLSIPADLVRAAGDADARGGAPFTVFPMTYGYEDDELAFRLTRRYGIPVLFRPAARAFHDHQYDPSTYLERERKLGEAAWGFAKTTPECARAMFGRDITAAAELDYAREFVQREKPAVDRLREPFARLADIPADAITGPHQRALIGLIYQQHLPLKRHTWRTGLLAAATTR